MKTTRRGAFGVGVGGLIAGPDMAKQLVNRVKDYPPSAMQEVGASTADVVLKQEEQAKYLARRKKELIDIINGKFEGYRLQELNNRAFNEALARENIECLKSISLTTKERLKIEKWKEKQIKIWQDEARETLDHLLSGKFGVI